MKKPNLSHEKKLWQKGYRFVIGVDEVGRGAFAGPVVAGAVALRLPTHLIGSDDTDNTKTNNVTDFERSLKMVDIIDSENTRWEDRINPRLLKQISDLGINDSKKLSVKKRESLEKEIKKYFYFGLGEASVVFINRFGMTRATERAIRQAVVRVMYQLRDNDTEKASKSLLTKDFINKIKPYLLLDTFHVKYVPVVGLSHQEAVPKGDQKCISIAAASIIAKVYRDNLMVKLSSQYAKYHWEQNKGYGTKDHREAIARFGITKLHREKFVEKWVTSS